MRIGKFKTSETMNEQEKKERKQLWIEGAKAALAVFLFIALHALLFYLDEKFFHSLR